MANNCVTCNKQLTFMENMLPQGRKRCKDCNKKFTSIQQYFLGQVAQAIQQHTLTEERENMLYREIQQAALPADLADPVIAQIRSARNESMQRELQNLIEGNFRSGTLTADIERYVLAKSSSLFPETASPLLQRLRYLRNISEIQPEAALSRFPPVGDARSSPLSVSSWRGPDYEKIPI